jgi:outer membrane biosynthesis protein TonB
MKRCPQCEFIYEDEQSLCDMDGVLLVLDSRNLPNLHALAPISGVAQKGQKRNRAVPAFATLILLIVLGMVYFVTTQRKAPTFTPETTTSTTVPASNPEPPVQPAAVTEPPAATETPSPEKRETKPAASKPVTVPTKKATTTKPASTTQTKASTEQKKDESKVGSILKKTGKILKKPFKF